VCVCAWCDRAVREVPRCKSSVATEVTTANITKQHAKTTTAGVAEDSSAGSLNVEPTQHSASDSERPGADAEAPTSSAAAPGEQTAAAARQKGLTQSSSDAYLHAVIPHLDALIAENDFSSLDAQKR